MSLLPAQLLEQIRAAIARPEGTVTFRFRSPQLLDATLSDCYLLDLAAGDHVFRLERSHDFFLRFYHGSPGTGTRVAGVDLRQLKAGIEEFFVGFTWSPIGVQLYVGGQLADGTTPLLSASGDAAEFELRASADGAIYQLGDAGVLTMGVSVFQAGKPVLSATALGTWHETKQAIDALQQSHSEVGFLFEVVIANVTIATLVTGLENYSKTRFGELEREGIAPNADAVVRSFTTRRERETNILDVFQTEAAAAGVSLLHYFVARGWINFQNYGQIKRAYSRGYGISVGGLGVSSSELKLLQDFIRYRHRIVHVSPLTACLNQATSPPEAPVFANKNTAGAAIRVFDKFVDGLHSATLKLRPNNTRRSGFA
jgi:hypothetical protein